MKLLQINTVVNSGSTGRIAEDIGQLCIANGWSSYIAYGRNTRKSASELIKIGTRCDVYHHVSITRLIDSHGLGSKKATVKFIKQIKKINPDIIHLHNIHGYYLNIKILFEYLSTLDKPIVWTLHDCWPLTGHCCYFDYIKCNKWKTGCYKCPQIKRYPASLFIDRSKHNYLLKKQLFNCAKKITIVPVSNWLNEILNQSFLSYFHTKVIHNGIDISIFNISLNRLNLRCGMGINDKFVILGVASVWDKRKGLGDFIQLSKLLSKEYQIVLVGLSDKQLKIIPSNVIGIKHTDSIKQLADLYSAADVFLNPTFEDNFPTTNLEALACGTPVITYNTGGSIEAVSTGTGFIVEKGDLQGVVNAVNLVKENGKSFYEQSCRKRAESFFNKDDRFNEYIKLYNQLLNKK